MSQLGQVRIAPSQCYSRAHELDLPLSLTCPPFLTYPPFLPIPFWCYFFLVFMSQDGNGVFQGQVGGRRGALARRVASFPTYQVINHRCNLVFSKPLIAKQPTSSAQETSTTPSDRFQTPLVPSSNWEESDTTAQGDFIETASSRMSTGSKSYGYGH